MEDIIYFNFDNAASRGNRISGRKIRLYNKPGNRTISFSGDCRDEIAHIPTPKLRMTYNRYSGEFCLIISSEKGLEIKDINKSCKSAPKVYSKEAVDAIMNNLGLKGESMDIQLSKNLAASNENITYRILL